MPLAASLQTRYLNESLEHQKFHVCPFVILWRFASSRRCGGLPLRHTLYYTVRLVRTSSRRCRPEKLSLCQPSSYICPVTLLLLPKKTLHPSSSSQASFASRPSSHIADMRVYCVLCGSGVDADTSDTWMGEFRARMLSIHAARTFLTR